MAKLTVYQKKKRGSNREMGVSIITEYSKPFHHNKVHNTVSINCVSSIVVMDMEYAKALSNFINQIEEVKE